MREVVDAINNQTTKWGPLPHDLHMPYYSSFTNPAKGVDTRDASGHVEGRDPCSYKTYFNDFPHCREALGDWFQVRRLSEWALWNPSHRSRVDSGQCFNEEGSMGKPLANADAARGGGQEDIERLGYTFNNGATCEGRHDGPADPDTFGQRWTARQSMRKSG